MLASGAGATLTWHKLQRRLTVAAALGNFLLWAYVASRVRPSADPVVLHYTIYFSIDRVGEWYRLFSLPAVGLLLLVVNRSVGRLLNWQGGLPSLLLIGTALVGQGILALAAVALLH